MPYYGKLDYEEEEKEQHESGNEPSIEEEIFGDMAQEENSSGPGSFMDAVKESTEKDTSKADFEMVGAGPDIVNEAKLEGNELTYPELVPAASFEYRTNLEGLLAKTGKSGKAGGKAEGVISAVNHVNEKLYNGLTEGVMGETLKTAKITDGGAAEKAMSEVNGAYDKALDMAAKYMERSAWSTSGKKRIQVVRGLHKYLSWEKRILNAQAMKFLDGKIPPEILERYSVADLLEPSQMLGDASGAAVEKARETLTTDVNAGEHSVQATAEKANSIRNAYGSMAKLTGGNMNARMTTDVIMGMGVLNGDSAQESQRAAVNLDYSTAEGTEFAKDRLPRIREIERVFETILQFDVNEFKLDSFEDLQNPGKIKAIIMSFMAWDSEDFFSDYAGWLKDPNMQGKLALDSEMFGEVRAIRDASGGLNAILNELMPILNHPYIKGKIPKEELDSLTPDKCFEKIAELGSMKIDINNQKEVDKKSILLNFYGQMATLTSAEKDIMPGGDPQNRLKKEQAKYKVNGSKISAALDAIRKKRTEKIF
ncbi:MAG: hypothetical protein IIZ61_02335 [Lachnospiraceae bacterium]|nr:hypothetical protein [Lachnospiraceae bacterium]